MRLSLQGWCRVTQALAVSACLVWSGACCRASNNASRGCVIGWKLPLPGASLNGQFSANAVPALGTGNLDSARWLPGTARDARRTDFQSDGALMPYAQTTGVRCIGAFRTRLTCLPTKRGADIPPTPVATCRYQAATLARRPPPLHYLHGFLGTQMGDVYAGWKD